MLTETGDMENKQLNYKFPITNHKQKVKLQISNNKSQKSCQPEFISGSRQKDRNYSFSFLGSGLNPE